MTVADWDFAEFLAQWDAHGYSTQVDLTAVYAALRELDGGDRPSRWSTSEPATVTLTPATLEPTAVAVHAEAAQWPASDWWTDWLRTRALLYACLYFTLSTTAEQVWPALVANLRDNALVAIAVYSAHIATSKRR